MITIEIVTPERIVHTLKGVEVVLPTTEGQIGIRKGHIPLITPLKSGQIVVKQENGDEELYAVGGGFAEVLGNTVRILADSAERAEELDEKKIEEAIARAHSLKSEAGNDHEIADAAAQLEANIARLKVIQRKKARGRVRLDQ